MSLWELHIGILQWRLTTKTTTPEHIGNHCDANVISRNGNAVIARWESRLIDATLHLCSVKFLTTESHIIIQPFTETCNNVCVSVCVGVRIVG